MLKSGAGLFFSALIMSSSSTELLKERHTKLCPTRDEMWGQLPRVQNADRKNAVNPSFSHCQHKHLTDAFLLPIHCIYHSAWKLPLFFFSSTRLFYSWITFSITFTLHISQSMCQNSWSAISAACSKIQPCQTPVLEVRSPKASLSPANFTQPPREKKQNFKGPYKWDLWQTSMKMPKQSHLWASDVYTSGSFMEASKQNKENSSSKSSFLPTVHMATNPGLHGFSRLKNLFVKLAWSCYFTSI